ncbi:Arp10p KNAG_0H03100 [Huiozyma naganishii CBS 8797]|uniref:Uncharacterized protein n=1 Tax=Huiozyma naganishii (strain ATCC MYA-139 / BCRC 22969 / CBS 8797 / KCTC 17520 / NBRC 10181 / NCYC 3082 / Yp74L-3) TaxID=1071383 RepID=J7RA22_HUIN7|nr:hypothetical protein KNAG_0H03100 [Kazachstania naganishii CBS 8797]CCK71725.1 hypothetical protein KNAG_0H03100 [Kazachstania naganishii CBS 8797]
MNKDVLVLVFYGGSLEIGFNDSTVPEIHISLQDTVDIHGVLRQHLKPIFRETQPRSAFVAESVLLSDIQRRQVFLALQDGVPFEKVTLIPLSMIVYRSMKQDATLIIGVEQDCTAVVPVAYSYILDNCIGLTTRWKANSELRLLHELFESIDDNDIIVENNELPLPQLIEHVINSAPVDMRKQLRTNIVVVGDTDGVITSELHKQGNYNHVVDCHDSWLKVCDYVTNFDEKRSPNKFERVPLNKYCEKNDWYRSKFSV